MLNEKEFLSPYGIRALSRYHAEHPYVFRVGAQEYSVSDLPAEYREIPLKNGVTDTQFVEAELEADTAAILVQSPNFLGHIDRAL